MPSSSTTTFLSLNNIARAAHSSQSRTRVGRGVGSGIGGTSGRGHKGQKSRSGAHRGMVGFEGGQMPYWRKVPKSGFSNARSELDLSPVNLDDIAAKVKLGHLDPGGVTIKALVEAGLVRRQLGAGVKLLARGGPIDVPLSIEVTRASQAAIAAVEKAGGAVTTVWMNKLNLRVHVKPEKFALVPRPAPPPPKYMPYYTSDEHRGYLSLRTQRNKAAAAAAAAAAARTTPSS